MSGTGDYISREAAMSLIDRYWQQAYNAHFLDAAVRLGSVYREMEDIPAADVRPVVRGTWTEEMVSGGFAESWESTCGICGKSYRDIGKPNFCPNCGADMRGKSDV